MDKSSIWSIVSLSAILGSISSTILNFVVDLIKNKISVNVESEKKRIERREEKRMRLYEDLYKIMNEITYLSNTDADYQQKINEINVFLRENNLYIEREVILIQI